VALLPYYCYSDSITPYYGQTGNATANGLTWDMQQVLPSPPGLDINTVIYNYTIQKNTQDSVDVTVQNENAKGNGYIFQETDRWLPGSLGGTQINKVVPIIPYIPKDFWGDGEIKVDGPGSVTDPKVIYTYKVDPCFDPQYDPNCPGYQVQIPDIPKVDLSQIDYGLDFVVQEQVETDEYDSENEEKTDEEIEKEKEEEEKDSKERLEKALSAADNTVMFAQAFAQSQMLDTMNKAINMGAYYSTSIPGGQYSDNVKLFDTQLPENRTGLRNGLAQQIMHEQMVNAQYK
jgi:hypothetical protein